MQLALAMSREEHDELQRKAKSDDIKLAMAIEQSKEQAKTVGNKFSLYFFSIFTHIILMNHPQLLHNKAVRFIC